MGRKKAVGLFSGGLDSLIAAVIVKDLDFEVHLLHFISPFFGHKGDALLKLEKKVEDLGMIFHPIVVEEDYIDNVLKGSVYGVGSNINACIDCHKFMLIKAKDLKDKINAEFVFTGEVVGQRPMSQTKKALRILSDVSGLGGYLLRPLSARLLDPTIPELEGIIDRSKLLNISGRGRKRQHELAKEKNIGTYPQPAGGCRFTDPNIVNKFKRYTSMKPLYDWRDLALLLIGRHFDLGDGHYLVVTRDQSELERLSYYTDMGMIIEPSNKVPGPTGLFMSFYSDIEQVPKEKLQICESIIARYTDRAVLKEEGVNVSCYNRGAFVEERTILPINDEDLKRYRL